MDPSLHLTQGDAQNLVRPSPQTKATRSLLFSGETAAALLFEGVYRGQVAQGLAFEISVSHFVRLISDRLKQRFGEIVLGAPEQFSCLGASCFSFRVRW